MKKDKKLSSIRAYLRWPLILTPLLVLMNIHVFILDHKAGIYMLAYLGVYVVIALLLYAANRFSIEKAIISYAANYGRVQRQLLREMALPCGVLDIKGRLLWGNDEFLDIVDEKEARKFIGAVFTEITPEHIPQNKEIDEEIHTVLNDRNYRVVMRRIELDGKPDAKEKKALKNLRALDNCNTLVQIYLYDETEIVEYIRVNKEQRMVVGLLHIDNYEEALETIDEVRRSLLSALVDRKINKYMQNIDAIIKKIEKDKYIFVFRQKYLPELQNNKFSILEEVRSVNIGNEMSVTISIGMGLHESSYLKAYEYARASIDLALGRGGDQAIVKEGEKILYYGGKSVQVEKNTRVKARVKAHALKELVEAKEEVVIMGHSLGDVDSFGAAIGVYRIAKTLNKRAHIVINDVTTSVRPIMERFINNSDYEDDMIISGKQAMEIVNQNTLLVIVDVNRPSYTECKELIDMTNTVVILDHHRRTDEAVNNAVLSYIEPYASSACEMVAEILQYIEDVKLKQVEADAMYSGIMIDTDNFLTKTGVRTFEAAAYLRRHGADVTRIRKGFRCDMQEYRVRAEAIQHTEVFLGAYAITICNAAGIDSPTIVGAQVANELLDIQGVKASFVLTEYNNKIYISARSIDELNVQVVMEKLGGGGHMSVAGAQLVDCTVEEGKQILRDLLQKMFAEGEL